ncbi:MAG: hypothetical protein ACRDTP_12065 [Mycobacteriales bacterium]
MNARAQRWPMVAGMAFGVLTVVGIFTQFSGLPDYDGDKDSDTAIAQKVHSALASSGDRMAVIVGAYVLFVAAVALICFALGLRGRLLAHAPDRTVAASLVGGAGLLGGIALAFGGALNALVPGAIAFGGDPVPAASSADSIRFLTQLGTPMLLLVFPLAMAVLAAAVSVCALQGVGLPRWLGYAGWLAVLGGVFGTLFLPIGLVVLWALVVGALGLRADSAGPAAIASVGAAVPG